MLQCAAVWKRFAHYEHAFGAFDYLAFDVMLFAILFLTVSETWLYRQNWCRKWHSNANLNYTLFVTASPMLQLVWLNICKIVVYTHGIPMYGAQKSPSRCLNSFTSTFCSAWESGKSPCVSLQTNHINNKVAVTVPINVLINGLKWITNLQSKQERALAEGMRECVAMAIIRPTCSMTWCQYPPQTKNPPICHSLKERTKT